MKVLSKLVITVSLIVSLAGVANANDRGVNGLVLGGGAGAIMGQVVGRNVESTIIGATVGGIIGAVLGAEGSHRKNHGHVNMPPKHYSPHIAHIRPLQGRNNYSQETIVILKPHNYRQKGHYNNRRPHQKQHQSSHNNYRHPYKDSNRR